MTSQATSFFDEHAATWEEKHYPPDVRKRVEALVDAFSIRSGSRVLDVGSGSGILLPYLRFAIGVFGKLVAFDLSLQMVKAGAAHRYAEDAVAFQGDVSWIPLLQASFDAVVCFACFPHFPDKERAMGELGRVLRSGGELFVAHLLSSQELAEHHARHSAVSEHRLPPREEMEELCAKAGFSRPTVEDRPGLFLLKACRC